MAIKTFPVASYRVALARQMTLGGGAIKFYAYITCRGADGHKFTIYFLQPDSQVPDNIYNPANKVGSAYLPAEQFSWYIDLLRNEKPVYAYLNSDRPIDNYLYTGEEPVGEGED
ncbi:MAG: hypothetical protein FJ014_09280 [Chloroflexi bacterium]|nr:hypothetical protein [Chloroflexota bacterium]